MGPRFHPRRFVPYVVMHEFEALLFSDCVRLARSVGQPDLASSLQAIRNSFTSPEEIDDSPHTAPSKRIEKSIFRYQKPLHGNLAALEIGLRAIRAACPGFRRWLERLEKLGASPADRSFGTESLAADELPFEAYRREEISRGRVLELSKALRIRGDTLLRLVQVARGD